MNIVTVDCAPLSAIIHIDGVSASQACNSRGNRPHLAANPVVANRRAFARFFV